MERELFGEVVQRKVGQHVGRVEGRIGWNISERTELERDRVRVEAEDGTSRTCLVDTSNTVW
jgi:hypothetical protein